jgi:hypothetical protein
MGDPMEKTDERPDTPKLPTPSHMLAVVLELGIVVTFVFEQSWIGLALCGAYSWFSATWAVFRDT